MTAEMTREIPLKQRAYTVLVESTLEIPLYKDAFGPYVDRDTAIAVSKEIEHAIPHVQIWVMPMSHWHEGDWKPTAEDIEQADDGSDW